MFKKEVYIERRRVLKHSMKRGTILITGNCESSMDYLDNTYEFMQDGCFRYYFGINRADMFGIIDIENNREYIFGYDYTLNDIIWNGAETSLSKEALNFGIEHTGSFNDLKLFLSKTKNKIHYQPQYRGKNIIILSELLNTSTQIIKSERSKELCHAISNQRIYKSKEEIIEIEKAVDVTANMHLKSMQTAKAGMKEFDIVANIKKIVIENSSQNSFPTICTINGQILHNHSHNNSLVSGKILLLDCGAKIESGYCGDMTSTFPVDKKFTKKQSTIYNILISAYNHAESILRPGITFKEVHLETCKKIALGLKDLGLIRGDIDDIIKNGAHALFMPHGLGHMIGMDVHDMENFGESIVGYNGEKKSDQFGLSSLRLGRKLENGFVFTVELGIYFIPELIKKWQTENINSKFLNFSEINRYLDLGGMRYEGDYVIENGKSRRLGIKMPKTIEEIEIERAKAYKQK